MLIIAVPISFVLKTVYVSARAWLVGAEMDSAFSPEQRTRRGGFVHRIGKRNSRRIRASTGWTDNHEPCEQTLAL